MEEGFEFFGGVAVFGFFVFLWAVGDGGEFVGALGVLVAVGAVGCVEGVAGAGGVLGGGGFCGQRPGFVRGLRVHLF